MLNPGMMSLDEFSKLKRKLEDEQFIEIEDMDQEFKKMKHKDPEYITCYEFIAHFMPKSLATVKADNSERTPIPRKQKDFKASNNPLDKYPDYDEHTTNDQSAAQDTFLKGFQMPEKAWNLLRSVTPFSRNSKDVEARKNLFTKFDAYRGNILSTSEIERGLENENKALNFLVQ